MAEFNSAESHITGTCRSKCPEEEIRMRETHGLLHHFEMVDGTRQQRRPKADKSRIVKEYTRPAAGKFDPEPSALRPADVLLETTVYLIDRVLPRPDCPWTQVYEYVFDRLRAVRQDLVIQRIDGQAAVDILERTLRFLVYSSYRLCTAPLADYDPKLNDNHVQECLKRLLCLYEATDSVSHQHQAEFVSLYLLYNLGSVEALTLGLQLKDTLRKDATFQKALAISLAALTGNFVRVFRVAEQLEPLQLCAFHRHVAHLHRQALRVMSSGFHSKSLKYPLASLAAILCLDEERDAASMCSSCGLKVVASAVIFSKTTFSDTEKTHPRHWAFINAKVKHQRDLSALIHGTANDGNDLTDFFQKQCSIR